MSNGNTAEFGNATSMDDSASPFSCSPMVPKPPTSDEASWVFRCCQLLPLRFPWNEVEVEAVAAQGPHRDWTNFAAGRVHLRASRRSLLTPVSSESRSLQTAFAFITVVSRRGTWRPWREQAHRALGADTLART